MHAAKFVQWIDNKLYVRNKEDMPVEVPPLRSRQRIIETLAENTGLPSGDRLYQLLR